MTLTIIKKWWFIGMSDLLGYKTCFEGHFQETIGFKPFGIRTLTAPPNPKYIFNRFFSFFKVKGPTILT